MAKGKCAPRVLDAEDVVRWACGELARKRPASRRPPPLELPRLDSLLLGRWDRPPGFPRVAPMFAGGFAAGGVRASAPPAPDALMIEAAIGELAVRMAGFAAPEELGDGIGLEIDPAAAFAGSLAQVAGLMFAHGRSGTRPAIREGLGGVRAPKGDGAVWQKQMIVEPKYGGGDVESPVEARVKSYRDRRGAIQYPAGAFCRIEWDPDPQAVVSDRSEYLAWRLALDELSELLHGRLETIAMLPTSAAMAPWLGQQDGDRPIDLFRPGEQRVYTRQQTLCLEARRESRARRPITPSHGTPRRPQRVAARKAKGEW